MSHHALQLCTIVSATVTYPDVVNASFFQFWSWLLGLVSIPVDFWLDASKASVATYSQKKLNIFPAPIIWR